MTVPELRAEIRTLVRQARKLRPDARIYGRGLSTDPAFIQAWSNWQQRKYAISYLWRQLKGNGKRAG